MFLLAMYIVIILMEAPGYYDFTYGISYAKLLSAWCIFIATKAQIVEISLVYLLIMRKDCW